MKKIIALICTLVFSYNTAFADRVWINDLRTRFLNNSATILEVNMRSFNVIDLDNDGLIKKEEGEETGNFLNAIPRLDAISTYGINTLLLMPINQVGQIKALGTAGSLYAVSDFSKLNPQLVSKETILSDIEQAKKFIREAHNRNIRVMVDMPAFGAYDLFLKRPELFAKDINGLPIIPDGWTDVRMFNSGNEDSYNKEVFELYKGFIDLMLELEVDGIRASSPSTKPAGFWKDLISYSRKFDAQMLWLAQISDEEPKIVNSPINTPISKLLDVGFDGYYGFWGDFEKIKSGKDFVNKFTLQDNSLRKKLDKKAVIGAFSTHDDLSPILSNGLPYSIMSFWLSATLPINTFTLDGTQSGDNYVYSWGNKKATISETDDMQYFVNRGKIDIYNYSRRPGAGNPIVLSEFVKALQFKNYFSKHINAGDIKFLKTSHQDMFAYAISYNRTTILVIGNINFNSHIKGSIKLPKFTEEHISIPVKITEPPLVSKGKMETNLAPGELQILLISDYEL